MAKYNTRTIFIINVMYKNTFNALYEQGGDRMDAYGTEFSSLYASVCGIHNLARLPEWKSRVNISTQDERLEIFSIVFDRC